VQSHTSGHTERRLTPSVHAVVNIILEQVHGLSLITNNSLIMTLSVCDDLFLPSTISHCVYNSSHVPILVWGLYEEFDPHVRQKHAQSIIETNSSVSD
jgi:hypothetical protein